VSEHLLSIDVDAELRKLSLGRLRNRDQAPVALVRHASAAGASRIAVTVARRLLHLQHNGRVPDDDVFEALRQLLDRSVQDWERHQALVDLESMGMLDLLVAFSLGAQQVTLDAGQPVSRRLKARKGEAAARVSRAARSSGVSIRLEGVRRRGRKEANELADALRFARFEVAVNGKRVDRGPFLEDVMVQLKTRGGDFEGLIGIPRKGLAAVTRYLVHGVLEKEIWESSPDGLAFEAVVQGRPGSDPKEAVRFARQIASDLYFQSAQRYDQLEAGERVRFKQLLFRMADCGRGRAAVEGVRLFGTTDGERLTVQDLSQAALGRVIRAVGKGARLDRYELRGTVFLLDETERSFVERHLGLVIREPGRRPAPKGSLRLLVTNGRERIREWWTGFWLRIRAARKVPRDRLTSSERLFLRALNDMIEAGFYRPEPVRGAEFGGGRFGSLVRTMSGPEGAVLLLTRRHPWVRAMVSSFGEDPATLYASLMMLAGGRDPFEEKRESASQFVLELTNPVPVSTLPSNRTRR
jgi:hypothetical protein